MKQLWKRPLAVAAALLMLLTACGDKDAGQESGSSSSIRTEEEFQSMINDVPDGAESEEGIPFENMTDEEVRSYLMEQDAGYEASDELNLTKLEPEGVSQAEFITWDGYQISLPVSDVYASCEATLREDYLTEFQVMGEGYTLVAENLDASTRTAEQVLDDCLGAYYEVRVGGDTPAEVEPITGTVSNEAGNCTAGFVYDDEEADGEIAMIVLVFPVPESEWAIVYEYECSRDAISQEESDSIEALFTYLNLSLPVSIR